MIPISAEAAAVMLYGYTFRTRVESWRDGVLLDGDIPVSSGTTTEDVTLNVPESCQLTVPRLDRGVSYAPGAAVDHPLASWGQRLRLSVGVDTSAGTEWIRRSWMCITDSRVDGDQVLVTGAGLLNQILEAPFVSPVTASGTYRTMVRRLVEPAITVDFSAAPPDRTVPAGTTWDDGRLDALNELLDTWPAQCHVDADGTLVVEAVGDTSVSSLALTDGVGGTAMRWGASTSRTDGAANCVVARGNDANGKAVQAVVYDTDPDSPTMYGGPFSALPVPYPYTSPLLTTVGQCTAAAQNVLARRKKQASRTITTTAVPFLALEARDGVTATAETLGVTAGFGIVDQLTMPLTAGDGGMQLGVRVLG